MKKLFYLLPIAALIFTLAACNDDDNDSHGLTAVAGPDKEVPVGETVELNASASIDMNGGGFQTLWEFISTPDGSNATISNASSVTASFVPDITGDYEVRLTISKLEGESTDDVRITAIPATTALSGSYTEDLHLVNIFDDPTVPDYIVTGNVDIHAVLTIDPDVLIHVMSDRRIRIRNVGAIRAMGTADQPVVITGESDTPGFWTGILVESSDVENEFNHVHVSGAGSSNISSGRPQTGLHIESGRLNIQHSVFSNNQGFGLSIHGANSNTPLQELQFSGNSEGALSLPASHIKYIDELSDFDGASITVMSGSIQDGSDHHWINPLNGYFIITSDIDAFDKIVIAEGAEFRFENGIRFRIRSSGLIQVMGSELDPVVFRGTVEQPGAWTGMFIESSSIENQLNHAHFSHAGHSDIAAGYGKAAIGLSSAARTNFSNLMFSDIDGYGIYIRYDNTGVGFDNLNFGSGLAEGAVHMHVAQMSSLDHGSDFGNYYVVVNGGSLNTGADHEWIRLQNGKYLFTSDSDIFDKITIEAGTVLEFANDVLFRLRDESVIVAVGAPSERIVFTRRQATLAYWKGIYYQSNSVESIMDYVEVSYAGNSDIGPGLDQANIGIADNARLTLTNSIISNSLGWGIDVRPAGQLIEADNLFEGNTIGDINYQ
jgi:hypothetical protein